MRRTSIETYRKIRDAGLLSGARLKVYEALFKHGPLTGSELNAAIGSKSGHKRLSELLEQGVIAEAGLRECAVTGERVLTWDVTEALPRGITRRAGAARPSAADVRLTLAAMRERHRQAPFGPEVTRVMRWLSDRFLEGHARDPGTAADASSATSRTLPMAPPVSGPSLD